MKRTVLSLLAIIAATFVSSVFAGVTVSSIPGMGEIQGVSAGTVGSGDALEKVQKGGLSLLHTFKILLSGIALIYLVYAGIMMVVSMGDEKHTSLAKKQIMYSLVAFLFVNIPGQLYALFAKKQVSNVTAMQGSTDYTTVQTTGTNIFMNFFNWNTTVENGVLSFVRVALVGLAIVLFILAGIQLITSRGDEEKRTQAKGKFLYGSLGLVFLSVIQGWVEVAYSGDIGKGQGIFSQISNLALFFAGPTAIFFLLLAGYYYVTSAGEEEKTKKAKSIVTHTFIAVIILLASYSFLKDLADFTL